MIIFDNYLCIRVCECLNNIFMLIFKKLKITMFNPLLPGHVYSWHICFISCSQQQGSYQVICYILYISRCTKDVHESVNQDDNILVGLCSNLWYHSISISIGKSIAVNILLIDFSILKNTKIKISSNDIVFIHK